MRRSFASWSRVAKPEKYDACLRHRIVVQWGDQDAFQHLNNVMYLRYFESARIAYMGDSGWMKGNILPIIKSVRAEYLKQVVFPATLDLYTCTIDRRDKGVTVASLFELDGVPVAAASAVTLSFDYKQGKTVSIPSSVVDYIEEVDQFQLPHVKETLGRIFS